MYPNESEDVKSGCVKPEQYLEYLLIAENVERRGQAETDPMKKARIGEFLREYWRLKGEYLEGRPKKGKHNAHTFSDIADAIGETEHQARRILKLNGLIPELQQLVSDGKLGGRGNKRKNLMQTSAQGLNNVTA